MISQRLKYALLTLLIAAVLCSTGKYFYDQRIVGVIKGNQLTYQGAVYEEFFGTLEDSHVGTLLGSVVFEGETTRYRLYTVENDPEYLHLSFGWDHRIYVLSE